MVNIICKKFYRQILAVATLLVVCVSVADEHSSFKSTKPNTPKPSKIAPEGMVWISGGEFSMGSENITATTCPVLEGMRVVADSQPIHRVFVDGFWMDETEVTNKQFESFVKATGYVTLAERVPTKEELPGVSEEALVAGSAVFTPIPEGQPLTSSYQWWQYVPGANWKHPEALNK